ncbi:peroxisomal membrane protein PMP22-like isoform X3 [Actinidia eriantha]|uniref:peroxisomal membrane protein PMP22-like isoform X3 n=1 Tax=Actinidia eriantha TaxID=165200 RepID=UPI002583322A|nr:peroxisomal membrane protein PMP22-like isoform X3 [Actinidia eriantha]XP_057504383.1 peroxisomal membrane protein PMP22-like isoform X3 [Actinidia eriantha]
MSEILKKAWNKYQLQLHLHPLRTKAITAGIFAGCNDLAVQKNSRTKKLQLRRLLLVMLYGFSYEGPFDYFFRKWMEIIFKGKKDKKTVAKKFLLEQLTAAPWINFCFMMYHGLVVEGKPLGSVKKKVRKEYLSIQLTAWKVRVMFYCCAASCWNIFLHLKARAGATKKA